VWVLARPGPGVLAAAVACWVIRVWAAVDLEKRLTRLPARLVWSWLPLLKEKVEVLLVDLRQEHDLASVPQISTVLESVDVALLGCVFTNASGGDFTLGPGSAARDAAIDDLIALVGGVDGILQAQARSDAAYFLGVTGTAADDARAIQVNATVLKAYRWQYIVSGVMEPRFQKILRGLISDTQMTRIQTALAPLTYAVPAKAEAPMEMVH
jgi:hypothetical protein